MTEQPDTAIYDAWLLHDSSGGYLALAADLAGCYATGASQDEALMRLEQAIPAYYAWLSRHDDYTPTVAGKLHVIARARLDVEPGAITAFFPSDAEPITDEDLDWLLAVLSWAYEDLLDTARRAGATLDRVLDAIGVAQTQVLANATGSPPPPLPVGTGAERMAAARDAAVAGFRRTSPQQRETTHEVAGQRWSLRRGLRESALLARRATENLAASAR